MFTLRLTNSFAKSLMRLKQISKIPGTRHYASPEDPRVTVS